jgi:hypothetical protein
MLRIGEHLYLPFTSNETLHFVTTTIFLSYFFIFSSLIESDISLYNGKKLNELYDYKNIFEIKFLIELNYVEIQFDRDVNKITVHVFKKPA